MNTQKYPIGTKFNSLTIQEYTQPNSPKKKVLCRCDCGKLKEFWLDNIKPKPNARYTHSCGCKRKELVNKKMVRHGMSGTKFYAHWRAMFERTTNTKYINAKDYVNISVCKRWKLFDNFMEDMHDSYLEHSVNHSGRDISLDRINVYKDYYKENCRWATQAQQGLNKKNTVKVIYKGIEEPLITLCRKYNIGYATARGRLKRGYSLERTLLVKPWKRTI